MRASSLPAGQFRYEPGSYSGPGGYVSSILCYKNTGSNTWIEHFCLAKPDAVFDDEDSASKVAAKHLAKAHACVDGGGAHEFALSLRHEGYKSVSDFRVIKNPDPV